MLNHPNLKGVLGKEDIHGLLTTYDNGDSGDGSEHRCTPCFTHMSFCTAKLKHMLGLDLIQTIMLGNVFPLSQGAQGDRYCNQWFSFPQFGAVEDPQTNTFTTAFLCK